MNEKLRLDKYLHQNNLAQSREKAQALIMSGIVYVDNEKIDKAGFILKQSSKVEVRGESLKYVSRGGLKLEKAINKYQLHLNDKICMDIGASTGGFTDCMLQNGAKKVYSIDVGYGQLAWSLRNNSKVVNMERTNFRLVKPENIEDKIDFATIDVSFISLKLILPVLVALLNQNSQIICLVKPQFEAGREKVGKKGVVKEPLVHLEVLETIYDFCFENNLNVVDVDFSPITGPQGNIEFLFYLTNYKDKGFEKSELKNIVLTAHKTLLGGGNSENSNNS